MPHFNGSLGGSVDLIVSAFTQLHRPGFSSEFETFFESITVVAYLRERKDKISRCFKNCTSVDDSAEGGGKGLFTKMHCAL